MSERDRGYDDGYYKGQPHPPMSGSMRERDEYEDGYTAGREQRSADDRDAYARELREATWRA